MVNAGIVFLLEDIGGIDRFHHLRDRCSIALPFIILKSDQTLANERCLLRCKKDNTVVAAQQRQQDLGVPSLFF